MRWLLVAGVLLSAIASASAQSVLRVGDQKGNSQAVMQAAGVLKDVPYQIEWKEFPAAAPLLEALGAGAIDTGLVGDAPFTFAAAANVPVKAIGTIRQSNEGLAILVPRDSKVHSFEDLKGKKIATGRGSIGNQLILAALESREWSTDHVQIVFWRCRMPRSPTASDRSMPGRPGSPMSARKSLVPVATCDHGGRHYTRIAVSPAGWDPRQATSGRSSPPPHDAPLVAVERQTPTRHQQADEHPARRPLNWLPGENLPRSR